MTAAATILGQGRRAEILAHPGGVLKLFRHGTPPGEAAREAARHAQALRLGAPAPRLLGLADRDGRAGIAMEHVPGPLLADVLHADPAAGLTRMVRLHRAIHASPGTGLPSLHARLAASLPAAPLPPVRLAGLASLLAALPVGDRLCHGDFHPLNVLGPPGCERAIDWADAACGPPLADAAHSCVLIAPHAPALARRYLALYVAESGAEPGAAHAWRAIAAAARLAEAHQGEDAALRPWAEGRP